MLNVYSNQNFEGLWCEIKKDKAKYFATVLYHPTNPDSHGSELLEYLSDKCEEIPILDSSARIIIAGDINQFPIKYPVCNTIYNNWFLNLPEVNEFSTYL
jgi:hypothetical protein